MTTAVNATLAGNRPFFTLTPLGALVGNLGAGAKNLFSGVTNPDAVIEALFANSEVGVWYDYSDLTTMFQDRSGTTPVTADGQAVGLILDKSKGLVLGSELVTNGTFDTNTTGWTDVGATLSVVDGKINIAGNGFNTGAWQSITFEAGKRYKITLESFYSSTIFSIILGNAFGQGQIFDTGYLSSSGTLEWNIVVGAGAKVLSLFCITAGSVQFDNISVKEIPGNHAVAPSDALRPLYKVTGLAKWNDFDAVDDVLSATFLSSLGSSCTVAKAVVGGSPTILTAQTIGAIWAESTDNAGVVIVNRALTGQETTDLTAWLTAKGATS